MRNSVCFEEQEYFLSKVYDAIFSHKEFRHYTRSQSTDTAEHISADVTGSTVKCLQANGGPVAQANDSRAIYAKPKLESVTESVFNFDYAYTDHVYEHIDDEGDDDDGIYI